MLIMKVLEKIFAECDIRIARYKKESLKFYDWKYQQENFWIRKNEDFVWIDDYKRSILKRGQNENEQYGEKPCLIIRANRFDEVFQEAVQNLANELQISSVVLDKLLTNPLKRLREMQIIYKQYRADSKWGRPAVNYPVYEIETLHKFQYSDDEIECSIYDSTSYMENICHLDCEPVIQMNTEHPCVSVLKRRMDDAEDEETYESMRRWQIRGISKEEAYCTRKTFINSKSLYKE